MGPSRGSERQRSVNERLTASDPMHTLSLNIFCDHPDVKDLTVEQQLALHEFFHRVLADGYKLYQIVPPRLAAPIIKKKFGLMIEKEPLPSRKR
jgi:hypothetical protein